MADSEKQNFYNSKKQYTEEPDDYYILTEKVKNSFENLENFLTNSHNLLGSFGSFSQNQNNNENRANFSIMNLGNPYGFYQNQFNNNFSNSDE